MRPLLLALTATLLPLTALLPSAGWAGEAVTYEVEGAAYRGYRASAEGDEAKGLVVIVQDWDGLTDYEKKRAEMLSERGYDAFALDLYGKQNRPGETGDRKAEMEALYEDREQMRKLLLAGIAEARKGSERQRAVVVGYCFGGAAALELASSGAAEEIGGYATFHAGLNNLHDQAYPADTPPLLIVHGGADSSVGLGDAARLANVLERDDVPYEIQIYSGAPHAFTVFGSERYRKRADEKSWEALRRFLEERLAEESSGG